MRVYHFVNEQYGIEDLQRRRLKIAIINQLNDPFELFAVRLSDRAIRIAFGKMKDKLSSRQGLPCFSRDWHNPVQWSHYAHNHRGLCLGFDVPDETVKPVMYSDKRLSAKLDQLKSPGALDEATAVSLLLTKFSHWQYEDEVRAFVTLGDPDPETGHYFAEFSDRLKLKEVIIGAASTITRNQLRSALDELDPFVSSWKARLAFRSFRVVRQQNERLWR